MAHKIPATIITGFLGSGKTTLIRHLLADAQGRRIALIINEFGDLGIDGDILTGCGDDTCTADDIVELSNGCICCTVAEDFIPTLQMLLAREPKPDHIVIETSGLALPQPLVSAFNWPAISTQVTVDSVITVVDGRAAADGQFAHDIAAVDAQRRADETLDHDTPLAELFEDQIACADMIVLNKTDLMDATETDTLIAGMRADSRAGVQVIKTSMGVIPVDVLLGQNTAAETDLASRHAPHHHHDDDHTHDHDDFESFVITRPEVTDAKTFADTLKSVITAHNILRLKGFAAVVGKPLRLTLQAVGPRIETYFDRPFTADEPRETRLVVIGNAGLNRAAITRALS